MELVQGNKCKKQLGGRQALCFTISMFEKFSYYLIFVFYNTIETIVTDFPLKPAQTLALLEIKLA